MLLAVTSFSTIVFVLYHLFIYTICSLKKLEKEWLLKRVVSMGKTNKVCPECGRKMKQQFIGLQHCKCGVSWKKDIGFFERTSDMVFALERKVTRKSKNSIRTKQVPVIRRKE